MMSAFKLLANDLLPTIISHSGNSVWVSSWAQTALHWSFVLYLKMSQLVLSILGKISRKQNEHKLHNSTVWVSVSHALLHPPKPCSNLLILGMCLLLFIPTSSCCWGYLGNSKNKLGLTQETKFRRQCRRWPSFLILFTSSKVSMSYYGFRVTQRTWDILMVALLTDKGHTVQPTKGRGAQGRAQ